jgi:hypothetical protein
MNSRPRKLGWAAMSYLKRYLVGEHKQVWAELVALGVAVRDEPLYSDALAVARETMRRVRWNIETLVPRLRDIGYEFGYGWGLKDARFSLDEAQELEQKYPVYRVPDADVSEQISELERRFGTLPLSLRAFYEVVGEVDFIGSHSSWKYERLDPLNVLSARSVIELDDWARWSVDKEEDGSSNLPIAPDEYHKYRYSGSGPYVVHCLHPASDGPLHYEWHDTTFINYLRICFRWGGFPGWERIETRPEDDLAYLTEGLQPI